MIVRPYSIDLSAQMAVCDANYIRILQLLGELGASSRRDILLPAVGSATLEGIELLAIIEVVEQFKYTSTVKISQQEKDSRNTASPYYDMPEMLIRVYHDASTAEVISYQNHRHFKAMLQLPNEKMYYADEKEQINLFLAEWLQLCQKEGLMPGVTLPKGNLDCLDVV